MHWFACLEPTVVDQCGSSRMISSPSSRTRSSPIWTAIFCAVVAPAAPSAFSTRPIA